MKRWQVWASVVGGLLSVGGPGTYLGWKHFAKSSVEAAETVLAEAANNDPQPPTPIPVPDDNKSQFGAVARASFSENSGAGTGAEVTTANDASAPLRPGANFYSSNNGGGSAEPTSSEQPDGQPPVTPRGDATLSSPTPFGNDSTLRATPPRELPSSTTNSSREFNPNARLPDESQSASDESDQAAAPVEAAEETSTATGDKSEQVVSDQPPSATFSGGGLSSSFSDATSSAKSDSSPPSSRFNDGPPSARFSDSESPATLSNSRPARFGDSQSQPSVQGSAPLTRQPNRFSNSLENEPAPASDVPSRPIAQRSESRASAGIGTQPQSAGDLTAPAPGERKIEGTQTPSLSIEKIAPEEIQVGKVARFSIRVRNIGQASAIDVVVTDRVPEGTQFHESTPTASPAADGSLRWELGTLKAGEESTITLDLMPNAEGELGSVAQVTFHAQAGVRTMSTRPMLTLEHSGPGKVLIGDNVDFHITVSNPGSGVATGVVIEVDVPEQLAHEGGREIMSDRFDLRPNETRKLDLVMRAAKPGVVENLVRAVGDASLVAEHRTNLEVIAPQLEVGVTGPSRRYLQRQVTYQISVNNPGTAAAHEIELVAFLPQGLKFVGTEKKGQYDQAKHAVYWNLEELPPGETGVVQLSAIPTSTGEQKLHVEGRAALDLAANYDHMTIVDALTELVFTVADENDPIEVGSETAYEIRITNNGSKPATNVQLAALLPPELTGIKADGPTKAEFQGQQVVVEPLTQLGPQQEAVYRIVVQGRKAGDHLIKVQIASDEFSTPVTKEESTKVYADN